MTLDMVVRALGLLLPDVPTGVETLDGYVTVKLGELAQPGQSLLRGGFRLTVLGMRNGHVRPLRGEPLPEPHPRRELVKDQGVATLTV
jgi:CBS domain containing-hemolysin-like protein